MPTVTEAQIRNHLEALARGDAAAIAEHLADDFVQEWPQSGERIRGAQACLAVAQAYPGGMPVMDVGRITGEGDHWVVQGIDPLPGWLRLPRRHHPRVRRRQGPAPDGLLRTGIPGAGVAGIDGRALRGGAGLRIRQSKSRRLLAEPRNRQASEAQRSGRPVSLRQPSAVLSPAAPPALATTSVQKSTAAPSYRKPIGSVSPRQCSTVRWPRCGRSGRRSRRSSSR